MTQPFDINATSLDPGILLLEASAGTGKTWSLTSIAVRLLLEGKAGSVERLLLVTFTRKATDELRQRLRDRLRETEAVLRGNDLADPFLVAVAERYRGNDHALRTIVRARRDVDLARVRTIHSFCLDILADGAFEAGLPLDGAEPSEGDALLRTAWRDTIRDAALSGVPFMGAALKSFGIDPESVRDLQMAKRHLNDEWRPGERPLDAVAEHLATTVGAFDFAQLGDFVAAGPEKDWAAAHSNECLLAFKTLQDGFDPDRIDHQLALFRLDPEKVLGKLNKPGKARFEGSELQKSLDPLGIAITGLKIALQQTLYRRATDRYTAIKERHALIDHDDVITRARARLADEVSGAALARRVGSGFDAALVDEFQDTDADQWEVFRRLFSAESPTHLLVLVGDPKQAIYRFRGADIYAYLKARKAADRVATLTRNFRSTPALVDAVNSVFGAHPDQSFALEEIKFEPVLPGREPESEAATMQFVWVDLPPKATQPVAEQSVLRQLAADVVARRSEVPTGENRKLAVLVRSHRQARAVMRALRTVGIDAVLARGGDIHDSEAMGEWRVVLRALLDPSNLRMQRRARATRLWGTPLSQLGEGPSALLEIELFARLRRSWSDQGVATMAAELIASRDTVRRWLGEENGERMVTDLRHGLELLNREEVERGLGPEALVRWAEAEARSEDPENEERPLRLDRESEAVEVLTNFRSKGLEFDTVFLPFAWHPRSLDAKPPLEVHDPATGKAILDFAGDEGLVPQSYLEEAASRLRMHYVELTRAKERCVVYLAPMKKSFPQSATAFLLARRDGDSPRDRGPWVRAEVAELGASIDKLGSRVEERLEGAAGVSLRAADADSTAMATVDPPDVLSPRALEFPPERLGAFVPWHQLSYTALVRSLHDRAFIEPVLSDRADPADVPVARSASGIFGFARGARAGICLHELLEHSEFTRATNEDDRARVQRLLVRHGLELESSHPGAIDPVEVCLSLIDQVRVERLPFSPGDFGSLVAEQRLDEWEFRLPVIDLVPARIAELVRDHWMGEAWIEAAADRIGRLSNRRVAGMLGGFVDLLFTDGERWTVLDWKSNDLGASPSAYSQEAMRAAMVEHDYVVQLLFYLVAAHRFLRTRIRDYDYDRHLAGASYVFLRGLSGDPERGWCNVTPPRPLIEAIDELFAGGGR